MKGRQMPALRKVFIWLLCLFGAILTVGLTMLAAADMTGRKAQWERAVKSARGQLDGLETSLSEINMYLTDLLQNNSEVKALLEETDTQRRNNAARKLGEKMSAQNRGRPIRYNFFFYAPDSGTESFCYDGYSDYSDCMALRELIKEQLGSSGQSKAGFVWTPVSVNDRLYLLQCYRLGGAVAAGWLPSARAFSFLSGYDGGYMLSGRDGSRLPTEESAVDEPGQGWGELTEKIDMRYAAVTITLVDRPSRFLGTQMVVLCFLVLVLIIVAAFSLYTLTYFQRFIQRPFAQLQSHVDCYVRERDTAKRRGFAELNRAMEAFDSLERQLNSLKIEQYEEKLALEKTQLDYFQLQIKPHFFVNTFSILHGMAQKRDYERIQEFCLKLSDYVRYLFRDGLSTVSLEDELKVVRDYLEVQNIRYRTHSIVDENIPQELLSFQTPPVLLLTFVENTVKHARRDLSQLVVTVRVTPFLRDGARFIRLYVSGSCSAFTAEDLEALNSPAADSTGGQHLGIQNVRRRMRLMYGDEASLRFFNEQGQSVVEIVLPEREAFTLAR